MRKLSEDLKFAYLLNSAVLVQVGRHKALIDGLPGDGNSFDKLPPVLEEDIMAGEGEFQGLDHLFFTHRHDDHFDMGKLRAYMKRHPETFITLPGEEECDPWVCTPYGEKGELHRWATAEDGIYFEWMKTEHLTYDCPEHFAYNILCGDSSVLFTGDMDLVHLKMLEGFTRRPHSFIFVNNVLLWHKRWCDMIDGMGFEKVFIYHVPSEENDSEGYRAKAKKLWPVNGQHRPGWEILNL